MFKIIKTEIWIIKYFKIHQNVRYFLQFENHSIKITVHKALAQTNYMPTTPVIPLPQPGGMQDYAAMQQEWKVNI